MIGQLVGRLLKQAEQEAVPNQPHLNQTTSNDNYHYKALETSKSSKTSDSNLGLSIEIAMNIDTIM